MKEKFLHFVWKFQLLNGFELKTTDGKLLKILDRGKHNESDSGPDFSFAKIQIDNQIWAGNLEIHVNSSDWDLHQHSSDPAYSNVILHVVFENDKEISFLKNRQIPVLELKNYIPEQVLENYNQLVESGKNFIPCEKSIQFIQNETLNFWLERIVIERLERKTEELETEFLQTNKNWEALLFRKLAYAFGLKINSVAFQVWAVSFDFKTLQKIQNQPDLVYALFFGQAGFLNFDSNDAYVIELQKDYQFLQNKFKLDSVNSSVFKFFRLRPVSFPTVRMMQLATLYANYQNLFKFLMSTNSIEKIYKVFEGLDYPGFWENHFTFQKESKQKSVKKISKTLIERIVINVIVPLKFIYAKSIGQETSDEVLSLLNSVPAESNSVLDKFQKLGIEPKNALESQALLELKKHFCDEKKCLNCAIGLKILKND